MATNGGTMEPLPADVDYDRALDRAVSLLAERSRSRWEIRDRLRRAGFDDHLVGKVDARLMDLGILDDDAFSREIAERAGREGMSSEATRAVLLSKGVEAEIADRAIAETGEESDASRALALARRRARTYRELPLRTAYQRLAGLLTRKGYEEDLVAEVCRRVLGEP